MAYVWTMEERSELLDEAVELLDELDDILNTLADFRDSQIDAVDIAFDSFPAIETNMTAQLADLDDFINRAIEILNTITWTYENEVRPTANRLYSSCDVLVDNGASKGVLTANSTNPFDVFDAGDVVEITDSENTNEGTYTIDTVTDTVMTFTTIIAGTSNTDDETITVTLKQR